MAVKFEYWFTQTSHSVAFVCTLLLVVVTSTFWKGDMASRSEATVFTSLVRTTHLGCFGAWFGAQVWVTFFAGNLYIEHDILAIEHDILAIEMTFLPSSSLLSLFSSSL